jgi:hypothetical protein
VYREPILFRGTVGFETNANFSPAPAEIERAQRRDHFVRDSNRSARVRARSIPSIAATCRTSVAKRRSMSSSRIPDQNSGGLRGFLNRARAAAVQVAANVSESATVAAQRAAPMVRDMIDTSVRRLDTGRQFIAGAATVVRQKGEEAAFAAQVAAAQGLGRVVAFKDLAAAARNTTRRIGETRVDQAMDLEDSAGPSEVVVD